MASSKSTATSTSNLIDPTIPEALFEFFLNVFRWVRAKFNEAATAPAIDTEGREILDMLGQALAKTALVIAPDVLRLAATYQGMKSWLDAVADLTGEDFARVQDTDDIDVVGETYEKTVKVIETRHDVFEKINTFFVEHQTKVTGAPFGGCFVGFTHGEKLIVYLITNDFIMSFLHEHEYALKSNVVYLLGRWTHPSSAEPEIVLSLIQMLNLSTDQAQLYQSFHFKRTIQRLAKQHRVKLIKTPPVYVFPEDLKPPARDIRDELKVPGMHKDITGKTEVVMSNKTIVQRFLELQKHIQVNAKRADTDARPFLQPVLQGLRTARIFEIPCELYLAFYHQADKYTTEQIAGVEWMPANSEEWTEDRMTSMEFIQCVNDAGTRLEMPDKRPFDSFYFAYNPTLVLKDTMFSIYGLDSEAIRETVRRAELIGHLVMGDLVVTCMELRYYNGRHAFSYMVEHYQDEWVMPYTLAPWVVTGLIDWVNDHQTIVHDDTKTASYMRDARKHIRQFHLKRDAPPPFYTVYMRDIVVNKSVRKTFTSRFKKIIDWSHRWEVRGHFMVRVKRGQIPIDAKLEKVLKKRKYKIYTEEQPPFEIWQKLEARQIPPKKANEWIAVLVSFRDDFLKGPEDKPLIPSVRKSARYANESAERSLYDDQDIDETEGD